MGHGEKHVALLARPANGRVAQACLDTGHTAREHTAKAIGVERTAKDVFDLVLHGDRDFITTQISAGNGVVTSEAKGIQCLFQAVCVGDG